MRLIAACALVLVVGVSCSDESASCQQLSEDFGAHEVLNFDMPGGLFATEASEDPFNGRERWYVASESGALWIVTPDDGRLEGGAGGALILPLNDTAREESDYGVDAGPNAPVFDGADPDSTEAEKALDCAGSQTSDP